MTYISAKDYKSEVAMGNVTDAETWNKFGYNEDLDSGVSEFIWSQGGNLTILTSAETMEIASTSANDVTSTGTGAQSVIVYGVDANYDSQIEVVQMNGTTNVTTTGSWLGINRISVFLSGASGENEGVITATSTTSTTVQGHMPIGTGTTQQAFIFTFSGYTFLADYLRVNILKASGGSSPTVDVNGRVLSLVSGSKYNVLKEKFDTATQSIINLNPQEPFIIGEKSIFYVTAEVSQNNTFASCRFSGIMRK